MRDLECYFEEYRRNTIGCNQTFDTYYGKIKLIYADWTASGRLYKPIEDVIINKFGPFVGNTHTETNITGTTMTLAYKHARENIKRHVNANDNDILITTGFGTTSAINKLQRILGLRIAEQLKDYVSIPENLRPVVFITRMEHHSNQTTWIESISDVVCIDQDKNGLPDLDYLQSSIKKYENRKVKIGSFTACSNVTGIQTHYHKLARIMHENEGICFVDFAASAPYTSINMHPDDPMERLDGIFFSPHKFLGGPGTSGVLIFNSCLYHNSVPDHPGGGTVAWTNPWGGHRYLSDIEMREDGGTPGFLQAIRTSLCIELKNKMAVDTMLKREKEMLSIIFKELDGIKGLHILAGNITSRLGIISFYIENIHYNLLVRLLNDRFGIQVRGGCSCAGTYGHYLLNVDKEQSKRITDSIDRNDLTKKPGWVRISIHPIMTNNEIYYIADAVKEIVKNIGQWEKDYVYVSDSNEFRNIHLNESEEESVHSWFVI